MQDQLRRFQATDPFGRAWEVEFRWLQNGISIRHADTVDCKYYITDGQEKREIVIALSHPELTTLAKGRSRGLTDPWCMSLAALHLRRVISNWEDMDKTIITPSAKDLGEHNAEVERAAAVAREFAETHK
jgi:hypothetical protein